MTEKQKKLIQQWFNKADNDFKTAKTLLDNSPELTDIITFHCQQAVEKYFKSYLIELDIMFKKTHNLIYLLDLMNEKIDVPEKLYEIAEDLNDYAVEIRYPREIEGNPTKKEAEKAYQSALEAKNYISEKVNKPENITKVEVKQWLIENEGNEFTQIRGQPFTYKVEGNHIVPSTTNQNIPIKHILEGYKRNPETTTEVNDLRGPSYISALINDQRFLND